ncbi:E3 ubiquitin-protein ligase WAV3-like [Lolium perenne]|uniref:E3 ubiquitin-protein ligase WAV3-like n=1 Tax=Lolium perenne TaxID=4522 RepID=UPI003A99194F
MEGLDQKNPCAICLGGIGAGGGQAIFTAECSHTFHFHCISASVAHGQQLCPLCNAHWRELPFVRPADPMPPVDVVQPPQQHRRLPIQPADPVIFDDDEQVGLAAGASADDRRPSGTSYNGAVVVKTHTDYKAVARDSARDNFAVLVHLKAPGTDAAGDGPAPRAPLDLVIVVDVSSSMHGRKLALLKQAMRFVIDILGPDDRLCIVSFSSRARRVTRLARMSDAGKALCARAVESLTARPGTNIAEGLRTAAMVLDERRYRNGGVFSVVLLAASIVAGELYADEERRFLLFLVIPRAEETDGDATTLLKVTCAYRDAAAGEDINVTAEDTVVARPEHAADVARSVEVEREHVRVEATEDIAAARAGAERGAHQEAVEILENRRRAVALSDAARGGDAMIAALEMELRDMSRRVSSRQSYARSGRAYMLAGMSAHMQQRGSSSQLQLPSVIGFDSGRVTTSMAGTNQVSQQVAATLPYVTPATLAMLLRSRKAREAAAESEQQQHKVQEGTEGSEPKVPEELNQ